MGNNYPNRSLVGFSDKINDPAFAKYVANSNKYAGIFAGILAIVAIVGFYIAGETSSEMDNPESLYIGFGIAAMFLLIALFQIRGKKRGRTWDGVVVDKKVKEKTRRRSSGDEDYWQKYLEYKVFICAENGKMHEIRVENDDTLYHYFSVGDKVRHHKGINSYEKFDKSNDTIIFCSACATLCDIADDFCFRCKCPLLK